MSRDSKLSILRAEQITHVLLQLLKQCVLFRRDPIEILLPLTSMQKGDVNRKALWELARASGEGTPPSLYCMQKGSRRRR